jgi:hypothetical protein
MSRIRTIRILALMAASWLLLPPVRSEAACGGSYRRTQIGIRAIHIDILDFRARLLTTSAAGWPRHEETQNRESLWPNMCSPPGFLVHLCPSVYHGVTLCHASGGDAYKMWCNDQTVKVPRKIDSPRLLFFTSSALTAPMALPTEPRDYRPRI